jgi:hypothetical protein
MLRALLDPKGTSQSSAGEIEGLSNEIVESSTDAIRGPSIRAIKALKPPLEKNACPAKELEKAETRVKDCLDPLRILHRSKWDELETFTEPHMLFGVLCEIFCTPLRIKEGDGDGESSEGDTDDDMMCLPDYVRSCQPFWKGNYRMGFKSFTRLIQDYDYKKMDDMTFALLEYICEKEQWAVDVQAKYHRISEKVCAWTHALLAFKKAEIRYLMFIHEQKVTTILCCIRMQPLKSLPLRSDNAELEGAQQLLTRKDLPVGTKEGTAKSPAQTEQRVVCKYPLTREVSNICNWAFGWVPEAKVPTTVVRVIIKDETSLDCTDGSGSSNSVDSKLELKPQDIKAEPDKCEKRKERSAAMDQAKCTIEAHVQALINVRTFLWDDLNSIPRSSIVFEVLCEILCVPLKMQKVEENLMSLELSKYKKSSIRYVPDYFRSAQPFLVHGGNKVSSFQQRIKEFDHYKLNDKIVRFLQSVCEGGRRHEWSIKIRIDTRLSHRIVTKDVHAWVHALWQYQKLLRDENKQQ